MKAVVGVLLVLLRVFHGVEPFCDARKDGPQCYGALGGAVDIQLVDNISEIPRFNWEKNRAAILKWKNNKLITNSTEGRFFFFPSNGTVRINDLKRNDNGDYILSTFDRDGKDTGKRTVQLFIQAPVSSVRLVPECLSQGQMKVSCLSKGDSPQYSWTLDGHTLTDSELLSRNNETNIIVLTQNILGRLVCSVRNQISDSFNQMNISGCGFIFINCTSNGTQIAKWVYRRNNTLCVEPTVPPTVIYSVGKTTQTNTPSISPEREPPWYLSFQTTLLPIVGGVLATLIILVISIAFIYAHKKKKNTKVEEDDQEMTYADVRIVKKQERKVAKGAETDVEYGQVKFSKKPKPRPNQSNPTVDDTVYAQVRKGR